MYPMGLRIVPDFSYKVKGSQPEHSSLIFLNALCEEWLLISASSSCSLEIITTNLIDLFCPQAQTNDNDSVSHTNNNHYSWFSFFPKYLDYMKKQNIDTKIKEEIFVR